jgi:hypothetical protein
MVEPARPAVRSHVYLAALAGDPAVIIDEKARQCQFGRDGQLRTERRQRQPLFQRVQVGSETAGERRQVQQRDPQATGDGSLMPRTNGLVTPAGMT